MTQTETIQVSGVRCERCVGRLAAALRGIDGLEAANANLVGEVTLSWDDEEIGRARPALGLLHRRRRHRLAEQHGGRLHDSATRRADCQCFVKGRDLESADCAHTGRCLMT